MFMALIAAFDVVCNIIDDGIPIKSTRYLLVGGTSSLTLLPNLWCTS